MTAILGSPGEWSRRRRGVALAITSVLSISAVVIGPAFATTRGGIDVPRAPVERDPQPIAWTPPVAPAPGDAGPALAPASLPAPPTEPAPAPAAAPAPPAPPAVAPWRAPREWLGAVLANLPPIATASGAVVHIGDAPMAPGHWGVYEPETNAVYAGRGAFSDPDRLHYVVAHELAHAYYFRVADDATRGALDAATAGGPAVRGGPIELVADCIALIWGARSWHYWPCPEPARAAVATVVPQT